MTKTWHQRLALLLSAWIGLTARFNILIILLILGGAGFCLQYSLNHLGMNTSTTDMLSPELDWRKLDNTHDAIFPQYTDNILVVIEAGTPDEASDMAQLLYERLKNESELFKSVYFPAGLPFFKTSSLLYLDEEDLQDLADNLAAIQPFLSRLTEDQSIRGLFNMLSDAVRAKLDGDEIDLKSISEQINKAFIAVGNGQHFRLSWQNLMSGTDKNKSIYREFIILQPELEYDNLLPGDRAMKYLRSLANEMQLASKNNIRIRLTGGVALSYEEMTTVTRGMGISALLAFTFVTIILIIGLQSPWSVLATIITLISGLIYTAWFAAVTVVNLNLISIAFAILYIGLGVDFAIHFCLRYREVSLQQKNIETALKETVMHVGESLLLCAVTTAIGFYAFIPTDYDGVAELGLISGTGMFISFVITMSLLPALLSLFPVLFSPKTTDGRLKQLMDYMTGFPERNAAKIRIITLFLVVISVIAVMNLRFDHNTLNLQPQNNESVQAFHDLLDDSDTSPWTGLLLVKNEAAVKTLKQKLEKLSLVDKTVWIEDFIPEDQDEKLLIIEQMDLLLGALTTISRLPPPDSKEQTDAIKSFNLLLGKLIEQGNPGQEYITLHNTINDFLEKQESITPAERLKIQRKLGKSLLATFPGRFDALIQSMNADYVTMDNVPEELRSRWYSDGHYRIEVYPVENLNDNIAKRNFVNEVRSVSPDLIGSPVIDIEAGDTVVSAFQQAFLYALGTIIVLLLILLERKHDTIYLLAPLLLAALFTGALCVLLDIPLNFANVIALPLLMGIGVDSGIHILHRYRKTPPADGKLLATSSARAVVISALTTIFSIGNLAFSGHPGTASMGILLTIGISMTLVCTLVILPSLLVSVKNTEEFMSGRPWDAQLAYKLIYPLRNSWVTPNHLTFVRLLFGVFAAVGFAAGNYFWANIGAICFVISNFMDHTDGELARLTGKMSKKGHYFDLASDAIVNIILFVGIGIGLIQSSLGFWAIPMGLVSGLAIAAIFYMRNEIEKSVGKSAARQPNVGIIEAEDVLYFLPVISLMEWLVPCLTLATIGAPAFALWCLHEYRQLDKS